MTKYAHICNARTLSKRAWDAFLALSFGIALLFQLIALPVEFDATARAKRLLASTGVTVSTPWKSWTTATPTTPLSDDGHTRVLQATLPRGTGTQLMLRLRW